MDKNATKIKSKSENKDLIILEFFYKWDLTFKFCSKVMPNKGK